MKEGKGEILIYETADDGPQIEATLEEETLWLSQALMAELFGKDFRTIAKHIKNIYASGSRPSCLSGSWRRTVCSITPTGRANWRTMRWWRSR